MPDKNKTTHQQEDCFNASKTDYDNKPINFSYIEEISEALNAQMHLHTSRNELSVIIAFYNEAIEVKNTIANIRNTAGSSVDIIVINDCSDDGYPYKDELSEYNIFYSVNTHRLGAALSKERGIRLSTTPFFIVLDAHMRFLPLIGQIYLYRTYLKILMELHAASLYL